MASRCRAGTAWWTRTQARCCAKGRAPRPTSGSRTRAADRACTSAATKARSSMLLETARLDLPEITSEDWSTVLAYQSDPRYLRYYASTERTAADVQLFVQQLSGLNH